MLVLRLEWFAQWFGEAIAGTQVGNACRAALLCVAVWLCVERSQAVGLGAASWAQLAAGSSTGLPCLTPVCLCLTGGPGCGLAGDADACGGPCLALHLNFSSSLLLFCLQAGPEADWLEKEKRVVVIHRLHQILEPFMLRRQVGARCARCGINCCPFPGGAEQRDVTTGRRQACLY